MPSLNLCTFKPIFFCTFSSECILIFKKLVFLKKTNISMEQAILLLWWNNIWNYINLSSLVYIFWEPCLSIAVPSRMLYVWARNRLRISSQGAVHVTQYHDVTQRLQGNKDAQSRRDKNYWDGWKRRDLTGWKILRNHNRKGERRKYILSSLRRTVKTWYDYVINFFISFWM